jgi:predicted TPR repeat methyltransferase
VSEWKLFEGDVPYFSTPEFFAAHPWVPPENQAGHAQRQAMVGEMVSFVLTQQPGIKTLTDLGCGDGSLLHLLRGLPVKAWGYDLGEANLKRAAELGLDVRRADIFSGLEYGDMLIASEVVEHLAKPEAFLRGLPDCKALILSSPSAETDEWHYEHHAWAWDMRGYADLVTRCGWRVLEHRECDGGVNWHGGVTKPQRFQAIHAHRKPR